MLGEYKIMTQEFDKTRFIYQDQMYKVLHGNLYIQDKGLNYADVKEGSELEQIAQQHGWTGNIKDKTDPFHTYGHEYKQR